MKTSFLDSEYEPPSVEGEHLIQLFDVPNAVSFVTVTGVLVPS
jgi:hypothetical protein